MVIPLFECGGDIYLKTGLKMIFTLTNIATQSLKKIDTFYNV